MLRKPEITLQILFICKISGLNKCFFYFVYRHCLSCAFTKIFSAPVTDTHIRYCPEEGPGLGNIIYPH